MPVWPLLIAITACLTVWGWRHNAWEVPAIALCGYIAMRGVVTFSPDAYVDIYIFGKTSTLGYLEISACTSWLLFSGVMIKRGGVIPGFFFTLSALTYPALLIFGFRLQYMGLSPIIAEFFAALALLSIGGGIYGVAYPTGYRSGFLDRMATYSVGMAVRQKSSR